MVRPRKPQFLAQYGWNWLRNIEGTKRAIINRLKRANYTQMIDTLIIFPIVDGETLFDNPVYSTFLTTEDEETSNPHYNPDFFSKQELKEAFGW